MKADGIWGIVLVAAGMACAARAVEHVTFYPSPSFDHQAILSQGLRITQEEDGLAVTQERQGEWPKAVLPMPPGLAGCSSLVVEAVNTGKELLKIRFAPPGTVMPGERNALMALPNLELKAGEKGELTLPLGTLSPLHPTVQKRLGLAAVESESGLTVFVYQTGQPRTFKITRLDAVGTPRVLPDCCSWGAERFFPFVDRFGQFKHGTWPGKVHSEEDLRQAAVREQADLAVRQAPAGWDTYGGWGDGTKRAAAGRFRVEKVEGKWWFVDPDGALWWANGTTHVTVSGTTTPMEGREGFFEGASAKSTDFRAANLALKYGESWRERASEMAHRRLKSWGVNALGAGCAEEIKAMGKTPYVESLTLTAPVVEGVGEAICPLIDPYHPAFPQEVARQLAARKALGGDRWCVGLGVDSGIGRFTMTALGRALMAASAQQPAKKRLVAFLKRRYGLVEKLNAAWKAAYADWDAILQGTAVPAGATGRDFSEFGESFAEAYFKGVSSAFKAALPNTLNLGCVLCNADPTLMRLDGWNADVVCLAYEEPTLEALRVSPYLERPVLLVETLTNSEKPSAFDPLAFDPGEDVSWAKSCRDFATAALNHPNVVGLFRHRYAESCASDTGGSGGLVSVCDAPHPGRVAAVRAVADSLYRDRQAYSLRAEVRVDASRALGPRREIERYLNNSILMRSPPPELAKVIENEYGRAKIVRCWVCLNDLWDPKTGTFNFNYPIKNNVKGAEADFEMPDIPFETYLRAYAGISDEVLLNVRRFERDVVEGRMTLAQWKAVCKAAIKHYKTICPNLRYIEALNEFHLSAFGNLNTQEYYTFYRTFYQIVNELNAEMKPSMPLLVGGPATTGRPPDRHLCEFVALYAADTDPSKRLDFLSYHYYGDQNWSEAAGFESRMTALLDEHKVPSDIPMFWDEMGFTGVPWTVFPVSRELNRLQASCVTAFQYHSRRNRKLQVLPWVTFHSPSQTALAQFLYAADGTLRMAPFGMAVKCWGLQKRNEVEAESTGLCADGGGLGAMGAVDDSGASVLLWNHQSLACEVNLSVSGLSEAIGKGRRVRRYLVDSRHSNCYADLTRPVSLETVADSVGAGRHVAQTFVMEPYAVSLLVIEPAAR